MGDVPTKSVLRTYRYYILVVVYPSFGVPFPAVVCMRMNLACADPDLLSSLHRYQVMMSKKKREKGDISTELSQGDY